MFDDHPQVRERGARLRAREEDGIAPERSDHQVPRDFGRNALPLEPLRTAQGEHTILLARVCAVDSNQCSVSFALC